MSAGGAGPFDMMGGGAYGEGMMRGGHMQDGGQMGAGSFGGESGLERCRTLMGTMAGMHRSMQSMMEERGGSNGRAGPSDRQGQMGRMDGGMEGRMRSMHGQSSMHGQMEAMREGMTPEQMRSLCRTMQETMRAALDGDKAASGDDETREPAVDGLTLADETTQWLRGARGFDAVADRTGQDEVVVEVGAGDGLQYGPVAVRIDPGTTVRWRWTGRGGLHNVAFLNAGVRTSLKGKEGATFAYTFDAPGEYRYECTPHAGVGMRAVVVVAERE